MPMKTQQVQAPTTPAKEVSRPVPLSKILVVGAFVGVLLWSVWRAGPKKYAWIPSTDDLRDE